MSVSVKKRRTKPVKGTTKRRGIASPPNPTHEWVPSGGFPPFRVEHLGEENGIHSYRLPSGFVITDVPDKMWKAHYTPLKKGLCLDGIG